MGTCSKCFSMLNVYWKYTRKWFLALVAGMAALELGLLLYYVNGGWRNMYIVEGDGRIWPMEYSGALKSIRLEYIVPVLLVVFMLFLVLSYLSFSNKNTSILTHRLPISSKMQILMQIVHSLIMLLSFWLIQFLIIIVGFLIYRYSAPDGLAIDLQIFKVFWYPGFLRELYPFLNIGFAVTWLICLLNLSILPSCLIHRIRIKERPEIGVDIVIVIILIALVYISRTNAEKKSLCEMIFLFLFATEMIWSLFIQEYIKN